MEGVTQFSGGIEFNYRKIEIQEQEYVVLWTYKTRNLNKNIQKHYVDLPWF